MQLVVATRNAHKLREIAELLAGTGVVVRSVADFPAVPEVEETGQTFAANALLKAQAVARATGCWALADDSGLEVAALGGRPGVYSARYAGPGAGDADNNAKLLQELGKLAPQPGPRRAAQYACALALCAPDGTLRAEFAGTCAGEIALSPRGSGGFGYDPLFWLPDRGCTMAELTPQEKQAISHRGQALCQFRAWLEQHREQFAS